ncbi:hypothetical protein [Kingella oralis]
MSAPQSFYTPCQPNQRSSETIFRRPFATSQSKSPAALSPNVV